MSLERYLGEGKMELFRREVESSTGIQLKTTPRWLIHKDQLRERQESGNNRGSAIVITIANASDAAYLCAKGLRFRGALKIVEKYWEVGLGSVCLICCSIGHDRPGNCGQRPAKCALCAGLHKLEENKCGVSGCELGSGRICAHITVMCANCKGNHQATSTKYLVRHKAEKDAKKIRNNKKEEKAKKVMEPQHELERLSEEPEGANPDQDIENNDWGESLPASPLSSIEDLECPDVENGWEC